MDQRRRYVPKRTIFTTALIAALVMGSAALAQTTPTNPQPSPTDPTCTDQVTGAGTDCINPSNPEPQGPSTEPGGLDTGGDGGSVPGSGTLPNTSPGGSGEGSGSGSTGSGTGSGGSSSGGSGN